MPHFWDHFGFGRSHQNHHNLQDGLFQIASQTCSILVKVNNTNNICYGDNSANVHYSFASKENDSDQIKFLIPRSKKHSSFSGYKQKLSTVLENSSLGNTSAVDEEAELWEQTFTSRHDSLNGKKRGSHDNWCSPSCIPVTIILILIVLVVLVPLLEHTNTVASIMLKDRFNADCSDQCKISLVETIPEGLLYPKNASLHLDTHNSWLELVGVATESIEIGSFYWSLRKDEVYPHNSSVKGEEIFQALYDAGLRRRIKVKIAQSAPTKSNPNTDTETLVKRKIAEVRNVNFPKLFGSGVLHTKLWIVDRQHFYVGSANMDWRSLAQVKELGVVGYNCSCLTLDLAKIFDVYWMMGADDATIPSEWPGSLRTDYNMITPLNISLNGQRYNTYISSSPPPFSPQGRTNDLDAIVNVMKKAEKFIYISVMDYIPLTIYTPKKKYWPYIDDAIREAAIEENVQVRMLISWWNHSRRAEDYFLRSLVALSDSFPNVNIAVKRFVVPANEDQLKIPFARVNHNKYMVTDNTAYIGTSNWSGDYFIDTAGIGFIVEEDHHNNQTDSSSIRQQLQDVFERDWNSPYAVPLIKQYV